MFHRSVRRVVLSTLACLSLIAVISLPILAADPPPEKKSAFTAAQRDEMNKLIHDYIVSNPEVITEAVAALQEKESKDRDVKQKAAMASRAQELFDPAEGTVIGNPKGNLTIVEFFDYNCGYCKSLFPTMMETLKEDGNVRLVLKEFPILAKSSKIASKAALAAVKQKKYTELHMALMSYKGALSEDSIMALAKNQGLDVERLKADMNAPEIEKTLVRNNDLATVLQVNGTPAMIIGKNFVSGAVDKDKLKELIAAARAKS